MNQITVNLDLTQDTINALQSLLDAQKNERSEIAEQLTVNTQPVNTVKDRTLKKNPETKPDKSPEKKPNLENEVQVITLTDVRAVALNLSKAGKQTILKEIFAKYNADKLSDISKENYPELMADLEAANG